MRALFGVFQPWHLILILAIVLIIFGPGKMPDIGKAFGKTVREFRKASNELSIDESKTKQEQQDS